MAKTTDHSTGDRSTGNRSTGYGSAGNGSTGNRSAGDHSTGYGSTGDRSTGDHSTGNWSISNYSAGHFSTEDYSGYGCFDEFCTPDEWDRAKKPEWLYFSMTEWVDSKKMTEQERLDNPTHTTTGGYLRAYDYKEAFQKSYASATREEQLQIKNLPNFNKEKFFKISGIDIDAASTRKMTKTEIEKALGYAIEIIN